MSSRQNPPPGSTHPQEAARILSESIDFSENAGSPKHVSASLLRAPSPARGLAAPAARPNDSAALAGPPRAVVGGRDRAQVRRRGRAAPAAARRRGRAPRGAGAPRGAPSPRRGSAAGRRNGTNPDLDREHPAQEPGPRPAARAGRRRRQPSGVWTPGGPGSIRVPSCCISEATECREGSMPSVAPDGRTALQRSARVGGLARGGP